MQNRAPLQIFKPRWWPLGFAIAALWCASAGCNFTKLAANQTVEVFHLASASFQKERDVELARAAGFSNLKLVESLLEVVPDNPTLLRLCARSFAEYTFAFIEDDLERLGEFDPGYEPLLARALDFYGRAQKYASLWLSQSRSEVVEAMEGPLDGFKAALSKVDKDHAEALFWVVYPWASAINLTQDDPASLAQVPKVIAALERVIELNERIYNSVPHAVLGGIYATVPAALGGNPDQARHHLERAVALEEERFLLGRVLLATFYYGKAAPDRAEFERSLHAVLNTDPATLGEEHRLPNELAQLRAARWLAQADEIF